MEFILNHPLAHRAQKHPLAQFIGRHILCCAYMGLVSIMVLSSYHYSGMHWIPQLSFYVATLLVAYIMFRYLQKGLSVDHASGSAARLLARWTPLLTRMADVFVVLVPIIYFGSIGYLPYFRLLAIPDYYEAASLRHIFASELPTAIKYLGKYYLHGIMPVWLVYCFFYRRRMFYLTFAITLFFVLNMITKAVFVVVFFPLFMAMLATRRWLYALLLVGIMFGGMSAIVMAIQKDHGSHSVAQQEDFTADQWAELSPAEQAMILANETTMTDEATYAVSTASDTIVRRLLLSHGLIIDQWMRTFPQGIPYLHGCGYRWIAKIKGCDFVSTPSIIWWRFYGDLNREYNMRAGTVTASHFINAYANFGYLGIAISGIAMGLLLNVLNFVFARPWPSLAINATFLALAIETPLSTLLHTGGWALAMLTYLVFFRIPGRSFTGNAT